MISVKYKEKNVGDIVTNVFVTHRKPIHIMRKTGGTFGISAKVLDLLSEKMVEYIVFLYHGIKGDKTYICSLTKYISDELRIKYTDGDDLQYHIRIRDMKEYNGHNWTHYIKEYKKNKEV